MASLRIRFLPPRTYGLNQLNQTVGTADGLHRPVEQSVSLSSTARNSFTSLGLSIAAMLAKNRPRPDAKHMLAMAALIVIALFGLNRMQFRHILT